MELPKFEEIFSKIKFLFWAMGVPFDQPVLSLRFFIFMGLLSLMVFEEIAFVITSNNVLIFFDNAPAILVGGSLVIKFFIIATKREDVFDLTHNLKFLDSQMAKNEEHKKLVMKSKLILKKFIRYYLILNITLIVTYNTSAFVFMMQGYFTSNKIEFLLPYQIVMPFDINSWIKWFVAYLFCHITGYICNIYHIAIDILYWATCSYVCSNFDTLCYDISVMDMKQSDRLKVLIQRHQQLLKLSEDLEDIFTLPNFFNFLVGSLNLCVIGFNMVIGEKGRLLQLTLFIVTILLQLFMMSVFGENLISASLKVGDDIYACDWHDMDVKSQKMIVFILRKANVPQKLTAYKFANIGYGSLKKIISTAWSYFTILQTMYSSSD